MENEDDKSKKAQYFNMAIRLCGIHSDEKTSDLLITIYERIQELGGDFSVHDAVALSFQNERKYPSPTAENIPNLRGE